jgi:homoserine O-succinyltransferase
MRAHGHEAEQGVGASERPRLTIALLNNMPDAALAATERQFAGLLAAAAGEDFEVKLRLYAFAGTPRAELMREQMLERGYDALEALMALGADGLIVTGAEPQAEALTDEPYWSELARLIDWARGGVRSAVFSCLAAHAAVLHLDGVQRRRSPQKTTGVFAFERRVQAPLTRGLGAAWRTPHSRWNAVEAAELAAHGYEVLADSAQAGVDLFTRDLGALFVFLQGHPEYDADSLLREYRRDLGRCQRGERAAAPRPQGYFGPAADAALAAAPSLEACEQIVAELTPEAPWRPHAVGLYRNWLTLLAQAKAAPLPAEHAAAPVARAAG